MPDVLWGVVLLRMDVREKHDFATRLALSDGSGQGLALRSAFIVMRLGH